ncbi:MULTISPECIES: hypothetical protein [Pasteurellaceae]|uniref:Mu-like prophage FluMu protein gp28 n=1 Tax=Pasteurella atlantica TaxID=2827233 RepID=A0AAW8CQH3_9PAST|nr:hypothetical protein [Pasteurella atlantica]MBR0573694.1 hypothetical protein [Pasteurella atlantica]MDP8039673.1 hypothetical protein [Pasteurella atlantica]MDP8041764.1 hypothetical protein [Pasteurella atlantica]MDP8043962.1 hypothetical protein [Pasteurella atlantica]MDP8045940.1 hypothetical protein [Pasteurella atlantica]
MALINERPLNVLHPECQEFLDNLGEFEPDELLLGYQKRWIADNSQLKIAEKSRRTGLTWAEAAINALTASTRKSDGGSDCFYIGTNKDMAREYIDAVAMWGKAFNYAASETQEEVFKDEDKDILAFVIYFASGFKVKALSSNPTNLRGMKGFVVIDESAFNEKLKETVNGAMALTMWGGKIRLISTHNGFDNLFNELIIDSRAGKKDYSIHTIDLDDACSEGLYKRICQVTKQKWTQEKENKWKQDLIKNSATEAGALEEYYCIPQNGSGQWLTRPMIEKNMSKETPVIALEKSDEFNLLDEKVRRAEIDDWCNETLRPVISKLNPDLKHYAGEDFARNGDLTVIPVGAEQPNLDLDVQFVVELRNIPFKQQEQIVLFILEHLPNFAGAAFDARGNGQYLSECAADRFGKWDEKTQYGLIDCVMLSEKWYRENTSPFKSALEDSTLINIPKTDDMLKDLRAFELVKGVPRIPDKRTTSTDGNKRHGDAGIALLLMHYAQRNISAKIVEYGYEAVTQKDNFFDDDGFKDRFIRGNL